MCVPGAAPLHHGGGTGHSLSVGSDALAFVGALEAADSLPLRGAYYEGFSAKKPLAVYYRR